MTPRPNGSTLAVRACIDRKSTRLNSSHANISYAVFCLKKKNSLNNRLPPALIKPYPWVGAQSPHRRFALKHRLSSPVPAGRLDPYPWVFLKGSPPHKKIPFFHTYPSPR